MSISSYNYSPFSQGSSYTSWKTYNTANTSGFKVSYDNNSAQQTQQSNKVEPTSHDKRVAEEKQTKKAQEFTQFQSDLYRSSSVFKIFEDTDIPIMLSPLKDVNARVASIVQQLVERGVNEAGAKRAGDFKDQLREFRQDLNKELYGIVDDQPSWWYRYRPTEPTPTDPQTPVDPPTDTTDPRNPGHGGTPPGQGGTNPGNGGTTPPPTGGTTPPPTGGTTPPPETGGTKPGNGNGNGGVNPGNGNGGVNPGNGNGGVNPGNGNGGVNPGNGNGGVNPGNGNGGTNPGNGNNGPGRSENAPGHGNTPPGHGGTPPGQVGRDKSQEEADVLMVQQMTQQYQDAMLMHSLYMLNANGGATAAAADKGTKQ